MLLTNRRICNAIFSFPLHFSMILTDSNTWLHVVCRIKIEYDFRCSNRWAFLIEKKLMLQFKMYCLKFIFLIAQKAEKESFLDGDSREKDKAMALLKSLLVKVAIQMKQKVEGLNIIQSFPEEALVQNQMQFRAQKVVSLNHKFPPFQQFLSDGESFYSKVYFKIHLYFICIFLVIRHFISRRIYWWSIRTSEITRGTKA